MRNSKFVSKESAKTIAVIFSLLLFFAIAKLVQASCSTPVQMQVPPTPPTCCEKCHEICKRSPNYVGTGEYTFSVLDLQIPTRGAFGLSATRNYFRSRSIDGPFGIGWSSNLMTRLTYATYLETPPSTFNKEAAILLPDGIVQRFRENTDGTFTPPVESHSTLVRNGDGTYDYTIALSHSKYHFAADGSILSMTDDFGNAITFQYTSGKVSQVSDATGSGRYINVFYGADGRISTLQDHSGRTIQYFYTNGTLTSVIDPANRTTFYTYTTGRFGPVLSQIKDNWGRIITDLTYDTRDRLSTYTDAGETWTYTYVKVNYADTNETDKKDSSNNNYKFTFDTGGRVTTDITPAGTATTSFYTDGSIQQATDATGVKTFYTYNTNGSVANITRDYQGSLALRFDYAYDTNFPEKVISITPKNPSTGVVNLDWQAWRYDYYQAGTTAPGALYHVYRVESDGSTLDTLATYTYNSAGQVLTVTDATGGVTTYGYNSTTGDLTSITYPKNSDSGSNPFYQYGRDAVGRVSSVTDPLGHATSYLYDNLDRITSVTLPKPSPSSPLNFTTMYSYDNFDAGTGLVFTDQTDPNGKITKQGYDQLGQLNKSIDGLNNTTAFAYTKGLLTSITDANNNVTGYTYDTSRRLYQTTFPDGTQETYFYLADGMVSGITHADGSHLSFLYDAFKRISCKDTCGGFTYTYTGQKLTSITFHDHQTMTYDASYRLASITQDTQGTVGYTYDAADGVASYTVTGGPSATYTYYADGSLKNISWSPVAGQFTYNYTLNGQYGTITFPNGQHRDYTYDDQGRLTNLANIHPSAGNLATYGYGYDVDNSTGQSTMLGQRSSLTATVPPQNFNNSLTKYYYDSNYQLTRSDYPNVAPFSAETDSWTYDAIGNRLTNTVNAATQNYTYFKNGSNPLNGQRLQSDSVNTYTYDLNGNTKTQVTPGGTYTFSWSSHNMMTAIAGPVTSSYVMDYIDRRKSKTVTGVQTKYLYDGQNLIRETGAATADYLFGPGIDEPLSMSRGGSMYYYDVDGLGSATLVNNSTGTVQDSYVMDAWGIARSQTAPVANPFTYTSREAAEAGLMYYRARYYNPAIGRFVSEDPLRSMAQEYGVFPDLVFQKNSYLYVLNKSIRAKDPFGLWNRIVDQFVFDGWCPLDQDYYRTSDRFCADNRVTGSEHPGSKCYRALHGTLHTCFFGDSCSFHYDKHPPCRGSISRNSNGSCSVGGCLVTGFFPHLFRDVVHNQNPEVCIPKPSSCPLCDLTWYPSESE